MFNTVKLQYEINHVRALRYMISRSKVHDIAMKYIEHPV